MDKLRAEGEALRGQWAAMQGRIDSLLEQVQHERASSRGQDELVALRKDLQDMKLSYAAANPEKYGQALALAIEELKPDKVVDLLGYGSTLKAVPKMRDKTLSSLFVSYDFSSSNGTRKSGEYSKVRAKAIVDLLHAENVIYEVNLEWHRIRADVYGTLMRDDGYETLVYALKKGFAHLNESITSSLINSVLVGDKTENRAYDWTLRGLSNNQFKEFVGLLDSMIPGGGLTLPRVGLILNRGSVFTQTEGGGAFLTKKNTYRNYADYAANYNDVVRWLRANGALE